MSRTAKIDVNINGEQAKARLAEIKEDLKQIKILRDKAAAEGDVKGYNQLNGEMKKLTSEAGKLERKTQDVNQVLKNISSASIRELQGAFNAAKKEMDAMKRSDPGFGEQQKKVSLLRAELDKATGKAREHNSTLGNLANSFNKYFGMATTAIASLTGVIFGFKKAVDEFNQFEKKVDNLSALTGLVGDDLNYLTEEAKKLSVATIEGNVRITQSADAIVEAYTKVGSARPELLKNKEDLAAVTQEAMILAAAADSELQPAVDALAGVLNQFNMPASESRRIINAIAAGSKEGAGEIPYLTEAIEKSGTIAADAGISIENLVGIIETLAPRMAAPEMAGRNLRAIILKLQEGADETNPAIVGFSKAIENLSKQNLSATELTKLFGLENVTAAKILINNRDEMNNYTAAVTGTNVALEQAAINTDNNSSKLDQARNKLKIITMDLGEKLAPALTFSTNSFSYLVKASIAGLSVFREYGGVIITATAAIVTYTLAVKLAALWTSRTTEGTIINTIVTKANSLAKGSAIMATQLFAAAQMLLTGNITGATQAMRVFNSVLKASPWGLALTAIVALGVGVYQYMTRTKELTQAQKSLINVQKKTTDQFDDQSAKIESLRVRVENNNLALWARKEALDELNKIVPGYNGSLSEEGKLINYNKDAIKNYLVEFEKQVKFKAAQEELEKLYRKKRNDEQLLEEARLKDAIVQKQNTSSEVVGGGEAGISGQAAKYQAMANSAKSVTKALKEVNDTQKAILGIQKEIETSSIGLNPQITGNDDNKPPVPPADDPNKIKTAYEQLGEAISKAKKELEAFVTTGDTLKAQAKAIVLSQLEAQKSVIDGIIKSGGNVGQFLDDLTDDEAALLEEQADDAERARAFYEKTKNIGDKWLEEQERKRDEATQAQLNRTEAEIEAAKKAAQEKIQLEEDWKKARLDITASVINAGFDMYNQERERKNNLELNALNEARENELKNKNLTEEQREEIEKKYRAKEAKIKLEQWKKQKKADLVASLIRGALSVVGALSAPPFWPLNMPSVISAGIAAAAQTAVIAAQKPPEFKSGGFTDEDLSDDTPSGITHANEFVANADATRNTSVRKVLNIIDYAQKNNTIRSINLPALVASTTRQYKDGGYSTSVTSNPGTEYSNTTNLNQNNNAAMITAMNRFSDAVDKLQRDGVSAKLVYLDFKKMSEKEQSAISATE